MTRIVCMQNKLLDFMSLQIQNKVLDFLRAKVVVHRIMVYMYHLNQNNLIPAHQIRCPNHG